MISKRVRSGARMKGQLVFEFVIAAFILFGVIIYALSYLSMSVNEYHTAFKADFLESKALQISEVLLSDPENGLVSEWPALDAAKMSAFNTTCSTPDGYLGLLRIFGVIEQTSIQELHHAWIYIVGMDGTEYVDCGRSIPSSIEQLHQVASKATVTRYGFVKDDQQMANVTVVVW